MIIVFSLIAGSCSRRKKKLDRTGLIPEKELVSILTDVYLANGLLSIPKVHNWYSSSDSISLYISIIEKHGYTKTSMDKTIKYYYIKNPKKLIKIYDQALGILSEMDSRIEREAFLIGEHFNNLWTGKEFYCLPGQKGDDSTGFNLTLNNPGTYTVTFTATLFPDDQSAHPRFNAYTCHPDSIFTGKRQYIKSMEYIKDGQPHVYTIIYKFHEKKTLHLRGWLDDCENNPGEMEKHAIFDNITVRYTFAAL
jgi:hypothetical protein